MTGLEEEPREEGRIDPRVREELEAVREHFKLSGMRWTRQRERIVEQAFLTHRHFSAEDLLVMLGKAGAEAHLATVYRTLQVLEEGGFIESMEVGRGGRLFEHVLGHEHHDHVICEECGRICEFTDDAMERRKAQAAKRLGFSMSSHSLRIFGRCDALARTGTCEHLKAANEAGAG